MKTKICRKCGEKKCLNMFSRAKWSIDGVKNQCKTCLRIEGKRYYIHNIKKFKEKRVQNSKQIKEYQKEYRANNSEKQKKYNKEYYIQNAEILKKAKREYRVKNLEKVKKQEKEHYYKNKHKKNIRCMEYYYRNREQINSKRRITERKSYSKRRQKLWQGKPQTEKEVLEMCRMLVTATLKASKEQNHEALNLLKTKYEQLLIMQN